MERILTHGSLFAGIGGFELGFQRQGFKTLFCVENNPRCQKLLKAKFPDAQIFGDVRSVGAAQLPKVDVLTYGFPCQDVSALGLRAGLEKG
ncbi:MAG: DNA cytosine methyltransferase, partial [Verrucomicrobiota bacterium]